MDTLPRRIPVVDANWHSLDETRWWTRLEPADRALREEDVDRLVLANALALADSLRRAGVLEEGTSLLALGGQVDSVDVVLAEVDHDSRAFRRLVLVESKLVRNPEQKRKVLAQIVEYSHIAQEEWPARVLSALFKLADPSWLEEHDAEIRASLRRGELLLIVIGDEIDGNLAKLARRFAAQENPLNLSELALVTLGLYRRGEEILAIPHVVSAVTIGERTITIQVTVDDRTQGRATTTVTERRDVAVRSKEKAVPPAVTEFLRSVAAVLTPEMSEDWTPTKQPRKHLSYDAPYVGAEEGGPNLWLSCVVQFEGEALRTILVGVVVVADSRKERDRYAAGFEARVVEADLPTRFSIGRPGERTLTARAPIEWTKPEDLDARLVETVVAAFRQIRDRFVSVVSEDEAT